MTVFTYSNELNPDSAIPGMWSPVSTDPCSFDGAPHAEPLEDPLDVTECSVFLENSPEMASGMARSILSSVEATRRGIAQCDRILPNLSAWAPAEISFGQFPDAESPEKRLHDHLNILNESISFGSDSRADGLSRTITEFKNFVENALRFLRPTLKVKTHVEETPIARTKVNLSGDVHTIWHRGKTDHFPLHCRILSASLESRQMLLQLLGRVVAGAAILAVRFNLPGGAITALPAVWRYIQDIIALSGKLSCSFQQSSPSAPDRNES